MSLCLTAGVLTVALAAQAFHLDWTGADGVARSESWRLEGRALVMLAARVEAQAPAPAGAHRVGDVHHYWPRRQPQPNLTLSRTDIVGDFHLCWDSGCGDIAQLLPHPMRGVPITLASCFAAR